MDGEQAMNPSESPARPGLAALFSALIPGAGQLYAGRIVRAVVVAAPLLLLIAATLFVSEHTVKIHIRNILEKLQLQNRIQAAVHAVRHGLIQLD